MIQQSFRKINGFGTPEVSVTAKFVCIMQVKKKGPNQGRLFYVCARSDGPPPHGRCEYFEWVKQGQRNTGKSLRM